MAQTLTTLNTKLTAHAVTANANKFIIGYLDDVLALRDQNITFYPIILVIIPSLSESHDTELDEFVTEMVIWVFYEFNRDTLAIGADYIVPRIEAWDAANVIGKAFISAVNGDSNIAVIDKDFKAVFYPEGVTLDKAIAVYYKINVKISC